MNLSHKDLLVGLAGELLESQATPATRKAKIKELRARFIDEGQDVRSESAKWLEKELREDLEEKLASLENVSRAREKESLKRAVVVKLPGAWMASVLGLLFSSKTVERVIKPTIADLRFEHSEALASGKMLKARWIHVQYVWILAVVALAVMMRMSAALAGALIVGLVGASFGGSVGAVVGTFLGFGVGYVGQVLKAKPRLH